MSLVGKTLLGRTFIQDSRKDWVKIDGVVVGESSKYGYKAVVSRDVGSLLDESLKDSLVVAVVYNWKTGNAFIKTGMDVSSVSDSKINADYTSFVVNARAVPVIAAWANNTSYTSSQKVSYKAFYYSCRVPHVSQLTLNPEAVGCIWEKGEAAPVIANSLFVKWDSQNGYFSLEGKKFVPVGPNVYWLGLDESFAYPSKARIEEMFITSVKLSSTVIRSHTLGHSSGSSVSLLETDAAFDSVDYSFMMAKKHNLKLICPLTDFYWWYNGSMTDYCKKRNMAKPLFWTNRDLISDFKAYISRYLNHVNPYTGVAIKDSPEVFAIELGNELGCIRREGDTIPPKEWLVEISEYVKSIDKSHLVLCPTDESLGESDEFNIGSLDIYSTHHYWPDYNRMKRVGDSAAAVKKPYIIGEYDSNFKDDWFNYIETNKNIHGSFFWSLYGHDDTGNNWIRHGDGFTQYYGEQGSNESLLRLLNHARRIQGIPTTNYLP